MLVICGILYLIQGRKRELTHEKTLMYAFASFWFSIALVRTFFYFTDYFLEGTYTGDLTTILQSFDVLNYTFLYFYLYLYIYVFINVISLSVMYIWFSIRSKREFQAISSVMTIGYTVFLIGWAFEMIILKDLNLLSPIIPPILVIVGALVAISPLIIDLEFFSRAFANWLVIISIIFIFTFLGLTAFSNLPLYIIVLIMVWIAVAVLVVVIIYIMFHVIQTFKSPYKDETVKKEELKDFVKIFSKPAIITAEEVQYRREKRICLVCKNKISRLNYICPECLALYCVKCSDALGNLENSCWVCETPFDETKPILEMKEIEGEISIAEERIVKKEKKSRKRSEGK
ncbi:MAG: hypothetical protein V3V33_00205 [Candidatus Lokiarchaeia archaeon]